jgi:hypothetical protein
MPVCDRALGVVSADLHGHRGSFATAGRKSRHNGAPLMIVDQNLLR